MKGKSILNTYLDLIKENKLMKYSLLKGNINRELFE